MDTNADGSENFREKVDQKLLELKASFDSYFDEKEKLEKDLNRRYKSLEEKYETKRKHYYEFKQGYEKYKPLYLNLKDEHETVKSANKELSHENSELVIKVDASEAKIRSLEEKVQEHASQISNLDQKLKDQIKESEVQETFINQKDKEIDHLRGKLIKYQNDSYENSKNDDENTLNPKKQKKNSRLLKLYKKAYKTAKKRKLHFERRYRFYRSQNNANDNQGFTNRCRLCDHFVPCTHEFMKKHIREFHGAELNEKKPGTKIIPRQLFRQCFPGVGEWCACGRYSAKIMQCYHVQTYHLQQPYKCTIKNCGFVGTITEIEEHIKATHPEYNPKQTALCQLITFCFDSKSNVRLLRNPERPGRIYKSKTTSDLPTTIDAAIFAEVFGGNGKDDDDDANGDLEEFPHDDEPHDMLDYYERDDNRQEREVIAISSDSEEVEENAHNPENFENGDNNPDDHKNLNASKNVWEDPNADEYEEYESNERLHDLPHYEPQEDYEPPPNIPTSSNRETVVYDRYIGRDRISSTSRNVDTRPKQSVRPLISGSTNSRNDKKDESQRRESRRRSSERRRDSPERKRPKIMHRLHRYYPTPSRDEIDRIWSKMTGDKFCRCFVKGHCKNQEKCQNIHDKSHITLGLRKEVEHLKKYRKVIPSFSERYHDFNNNEIYFAVKHSDDLKECRNFKSHGCRHGPKCFRIHDETQMTLGLYWELIERRLDSNS